MRFQAGRAFAIFVIASFFLMDTTSAISNSLLGLPEPLGDSDVDRLFANAGNADVENLLDSVGKGSILDVVANLTGLPGMQPLGTPVASHVLGLPLPPSLMPAQYATDASGREQPLRHALLVWNKALGLQDEASLLADPELERADALPLDVQVAVASLLYALTDATMLQARAIEGLDAAEKQLLLSAPDSIMAAGPDPQAWVDDPHIAAISKAGTKVDMGLIQGATEIVSSTVAYVLPTIEAWGRAQRESARQSQQYIDDLGAYLDTHSPTNLADMHRIERLDALSDALLMAGDWSGSIPSLAPLEPAPGSSLSDALRGLAAATGVPVSLEPMALAQADMLPEGLQRAVARIVINQQAWMEAVLLQDPTDPANQMAAVAAAARVVEAVKASAPTIEAFGLLYAHNAYPSLPNTPMDLPRAIPGMVLTADALARQGTPVAALHAGFLAQGADAMAVAAPPLPPRGSLETAVLDLYERYGLDVDQQTRKQLHDDVGALAPTVERNAARMLMAQLAATDRLTSLYSNLSLEDLALLESAVPAQVQNRILEGDITIDLLQQLEAYYDIVDRVRDAYYEASLMVAAATEASKDVLDGYTQKKMERELADAPAWGKYVVAAMNFLLPGASAQVVDDPCPDQDPSCVNNTLFPGACEDPAAASCKNDVLFADPLLGTVVIGGFGRTIYSPAMGRLMTEQESPNNLRAEAEARFPVRGHVMSLDLGGDDTYRSNAGGSILTFQASSFVTTDCGGSLGTARPTCTEQRSVVDPSAVATALDLGGNDQYALPDLPSPEGGIIDSEPESTPTLDVIQGASAGGIGLLWNVAGDDSYTARTMAQGFGGNMLESQRPDGLDCSAPAQGDLESEPVCLAGLFGIGILMDGGGNDVYSAPGMAQGATYQSELAFSTFSEMTGVGGLGLLVDASGNDHYGLASGGLGQGHGDAGFGALIDGAGDDQYSGGSQGQGRNGGLGVLVDLDGQDEYTRRNAHTNGRLADGTCRAAVRPGDPFAPVAPGFGIFADLQGSGCTINPFHTIADLPEVNGEAIGDEAMAVVQQLQDELTGLVLDVLATGDSDGDGWPDGVETALGTDAENAADSPGGIPGKPDDWPPAAPHPSEMGIPGPVAPQYILRIPGIFVLGDATNTEYPSGSEDGTEQVPDRDHLISLDIGGNNLYQNMVGGPITIAGSPSLATLAVSFGEGVDRYDQGGSSCVQGCNYALLLDLGGNDHYEADSLAQGAVAANGLENGVAAVFDAAGDDSFSANARSQGYSQTRGLNNGGASAVFIDATGEDTYEAPSQGFADHTSPQDCFFSGCSFPGSASQGRLAYVGIFLELAGEDTYRPSGVHGDATSAQVDRDRSFLRTPPNIGVFVDNAGRDSYMGRPDHPGGPDFSNHRNDLFVVKYGNHGASRSDTGIFWDRDWTSASEPEPSMILEMKSLGVAIGAAAASQYPDDYALLIDPGGDDLYHNNAGGTLLRAAAGGTLTADWSGPVAVASLLLDLEGNDLYDGTESRLASEYDVSPLPTSGDPQGRDLAGAFSRPSKTGILVQGAGFLGVGMLGDLGNQADLFEARGMAQGFGLLGSGILWSQGGDDAFQMSSVVVRNPVVGGSSRGYVAWEELLPWAIDDDAGLTWRPMARHPVEACRFPLLDDATRGPVRDLSLAADGSAAVMSLFTEESGFPRWEARHVDVAFGNACKDVEIGNSKTLAPHAESNQLHPIAGPAGVLHDEFPFYVWQDDRNGEWDLYWNTGPKDSQDREEFVIEGSDQTRPAYADKTLAFEDNVHGPSSIYAIDFVSLQKTRLSVDPSDGSPLPGEHTRPSLSAVLAAWHMQDGGPECISECIAVLHRLLDGSESLRFLDPRLDGFPLGNLDPEEDDLGELMDPRVSGTRVVFTHIVPGAPDRVLSYDWVDNDFTVQAEGAQEITIHPSNPNVMAWTDQTGTAPAVDQQVGSPMWEVRWQPDSGSFPASRTGDEHYGTFMQGVAWQAGLGLLFNPGGLDTYEARHWAQGAAFSRGDQNTESTPAGDGEALDANLNHGASGLVVDLDGNDMYKAQTVGQGAHFGGEFETSTVCAEVPPGMPAAQAAIAHLEFVENAGLLFDVRGADRYASNSESQGYSALVVGKNQVDRPANCPPRWETNAGDVLARDAYLIASLGMLLDLGGRDGYAYGAEVATLLSLQEPDPENFATCTDDVAAQFAQNWDSITSVDLVPLMHQALGEILFSEHGLPPEAWSAWEELWKLEETTGEMVVQFAETWLGMPVRINLHPVRAVAEGVLSTKILLPPEAQEEWEALWALDQVVGELCADLDRDVAELWRTLMDEQQVRSVRHEVFGDSGSRNNEIWNQASRVAPLAGLSVGGVGADLPSTDQIGHRLRQVSDGLLGIPLLAPYDTDLEHVVSPVQDTVKLVTKVEYQEGSDQAIEVQRVEIFIDDEFEGYADGCGSNMWCLTWETDHAAWPDDDYEVQTIVHYAPKNLDFAVGYVDEVQTFTVNNKPRFEHVSPQSWAFSPEPALFATDPSGPVAIDLSVSPDHPDPKDEGIRTLPGQDDAAWVRVGVYDAPGSVEPVAELYTFERDPPVKMKGIEGIQGGLRVTWDGTDDSGDYVPSGTYFIRIDATDDKNDPDRTRPHLPLIEVDVDSDPPAGGCVRTHAFASACPAFVPIGISKGKPKGLQGNMDLHFSIPSIPAGNDPAWAHIFGDRQKAGEDPTGWQPEQKLALQAGTFGVGGAVELDHGETVRLLVVFEDSVGNVECIPSCGAGHEDLAGVPDIGDILHAAEEKAALDDGAHVTEFFADFTRPQISLPDQGRLYLLDGDEKPDGQYRMSPERDIAIRFRAEEHTGGIVGEITWFSEEFGNDGSIVSMTSEVLIGCQDEQIQPDEDGTCADGKYAVTWSEWDELLKAKDWPEGRLFWEAQFKDGVGNVPSSTQRFAGKLILDRTSPLLDASATRIDYPKGGATVTQAGDIVTIHVTVNDPPISQGRFPSDWRQFKVMLDASAVTDFTDPSCSPDRLCMTPDPVKEGRFSVSFPVGRDGLDLLQPGWSESLALEIADQAGNWNMDESVDLLLGDPQLGLAQFEEPEATVDSVTIQWETTVDADVSLWFGEVDSQPQRFESLGSTLHQFTLPSTDFPIDIKPATLYTYRLEAVDGDGLAQAAGPFLVPTLAGVDGGFSQPQDGDVLAGIVPAEGFVGVLSDHGADVRVQLRMLNPELTGGSRLAMDEIVHDSPYHSQGDLLYWDADDSGDVSRHDLRLAGFGQGTVVDEGDFDASAPFSASILPGGFHFVDADGECAAGADDRFYLTRHTAAAAGAVAPGDIRIGGPDHGTHVLPGDDDVGDLLSAQSHEGTCAGGSQHAALAAGTADVDGSGHLSLDDGAYVDVDGVGAVSIGDIRLSDVRLSDDSVLPAGSRVETDDPDLGLTMAALGGQAAFLNADGDQVFAKELVTGALPDGIYDLEAVFTYQSPVLKEEHTRTITNLLVDNSPPQISAMDPAPGQTLPGSPDALVLEATDEWTAIVPGSARLRINGQLVSGTTATSLDTADEGRTATVSIALPDELPMGPLRITATIQDAAGNIGVFSYNVLHDGEAPGAGNADAAIEVSYPDGQQAAQPSDMVRIRAHLEDATGIEDVTVDASPVAGESVVHLLPGNDGHEVNIQIGDDVATDTFLLEVMATDELGHESVFLAEVRVERDAPDLVGFDSVATSMDAARLGFALSREAQVWVAVYEGDVLLARVPATADDLSAFPGLAGASSVHGYGATLSGLEPGTLYHIDVEAIGLSSLEMHEEKGWRFAPVVVAPPEVHGLAGDVARGDRVQLVWDLAHGLPERAIKYLVHRAGEHGFEPLAETWATRFDDRPGPGTYRYFVQAQSLDGMLGETSDIIEVTVSQPTGVASWSVTPSRGTEDTPFTFTAVVTSASTATPSAWVVLEGTPYRMDLASGDCRQECQFATTIQVPAAFRALQQGFHVEVMDAGGILRGPETGEAAGPRVVLGADEEADARGIPAAGLASLGALLAIAAIRRRNRQ